MERDKDGKSPVKEKEMFLCPECGETWLLVYHPLRIRCPECNKRKNRAESRRRAQQMKEDLGIKRGALKETPETKKSSQVDKDFQKQTKQCQGCHWWRSDAGGTGFCCHYYLIHGVGHRRDPGNGPGDCRSFEPKKLLSRKQMVEDAKKLLEQIEKDYYAQMPRKGDGSNG